MEEQLVVNTILRTDCACPGCQVEVPTLNQNLAEESVQSTSKSVHGGDTRSKIPLIKEVVEVINYPLQGVPSMVGPNHTKADKTSCLVNINSMQLVPFTGSRGYEHTARSSRLADVSPSKGNGAAISYLDALTSNLGLPKLCTAPLKVNTLIPPIPKEKNNLSIVVHKKQVTWPLKVNTFISLIPNHIPQNPENSLSIVSPPKKGTPRALKDFIQDSSLPSGSDALDEKPKRKQRSVENILGLSKPTKTKKGGRRGKQKCVVFRSAMAAAALSVSTEGITNKNKILISESRAAWSVTKILGTDYMGNAEKVISRIMVTDEEAELRDILLSNSK
ncbi:hypothetical protein Acr_00g0015420 [Actinidia rufa]|uniref:Uncharacterized protein n=1 Tax=Actinidia rufa TaxID=165716 RepID=A0A7J0DBZ8_9ERIC|nr:hypothetical protein Acr_00g0015420 [Actinidia rufa]